MNDAAIVLFFLTGIALLLAMRWAHRAWGRALLATLFAPLVAIPMGFVGLVGCSFLLRFLNLPFEKIEKGMSTEMIGIVSGMITGAVILLLLFLYLRDQRLMNGMETGPRLGVRQTFPEPSIGVKRRIR